MLTYFKFITTILFPFRIFISDDNSVEPECDSQSLSIKNIEFIGKKSNHPLKQL